MKSVLKDRDIFVLSILKGEEIIEELERFCAEHDIQAGVFSFIGAVGELELAWYDTAQKRYETKRFAENLEIDTASGNVSLKDNAIAVHCHGVFSDKEMRTIGGHIVKAVVSGACEVSLKKLSGIVQREYDKDTGLFLLT